MNIKIGVLKESILPDYNSCAGNGFTIRNDCQYPGLMVELISGLLRRANITYDLVYVPYDTGINVGNNWTGALGNVFNHLVDTLIYTADFTEVRSRSFDFTYPTAFESYAFVHKSTDESYHAYAVALLKPFKSFLWVSIFVTFVLFFLIWLLLYRQRTLLKHSGWIQEMWDFVCFVQGEFAFDQVGNGRNSKHLFLITLAVFSVFFSSVYQGLLLLGFFNYKSPILFSTFPELMELLESGELKMVTDSDEWSFFEQVKAGDSEIFDRMKRVFETNNYVKVDTLDDVIPYLHSGKYVYPTTKFFSSVYFSGHCGLSMMEMTDNVLFAGFVFHKNSPAVPLMDDAIMNLFPMFEHLNRRYTDNNFKSHVNIPKCSYTSKSYDHNTLSLLDLSGAFILFVFGIILSLPILFCELSHCRFLPLNQHKNKYKRKTLKRQGAIYRRNSLYQSTCD